MQQTAVNVALVTVNETKLAFIQDESFYPSTDVIIGERRE